MTHDPLCSHVRKGHGDDCLICDIRGCECDFIAKVRADERGKDDKEDDRRAKRDKVAREILDSETFMWLMAGSDREQYYLRELRRAYLSYCTDLDGGYGRWHHRQRNKPWQNNNENAMELTEE